MLARNRFLRWPTALSMAFFDILAHVSIRRCFKKLVTSAGVADTYKMCDSKMLAPCVIIITHQGADFPHHHHHHHRCMLDVGRCPQTSPLCPDPSIRLAELFFSYISCPVLIRILWRWEMLPLLPTKNSMVSQPWQQNCFFVIPDQTWSLSSEL